MKLHHLPLLLLPLSALADSDRQPYACDNYLSSEIINVTLNTSNGLIDGDNELITTSSNPNLMVDEVPSNDQFTRNFVVVIDGGALSLQVLTDDFPTETSWDIEDMDGNVIYESDPYNQGQTLYLFEMC